MDISQAQVEKSKKVHQAKMESYNQEIREHRDSGGIMNCDYVIHRQIMSGYHRGAYNALNELECNV